MVKVHVLFVCLGNICRSPSAEGVFRAFVEEAGLSHVIQTDSAGTSNWHVGQPPDGRATETAHDRGIDITDLRGRQAVRSDFDRFDYVLAMDDQNLADLALLAGTSRQDRLHLFLDFAPKLEEREVPDPYYHGGFPYVLGLIETASQGLLDEIKQTHLSAA